MNLKKQYHKLKSILGLSLSLAKAEFKLRNEGSYLGILWYLLNPLIMFLILLFLRGVISNTKIEYYPLYLLLGLIMFNFFRGTTNQSIKAISGSSGFIKSMKIDSESLVISKVLQNSFSHFFEILIFTIFLIFFKISLINILFYLLIFPLFFLFVLGVSFLLATIGVYINDFENVWPVISMLIWFLTPIFYVIKPGSKIYLENLFNPIFYFINISRNLIVYNKIPELWMIGIVIIISFFCFFAGLLVFKRYKNKFAELI